MEKAFNPLRDQPPETCSVNGNEYRIQSDFRTVLDWIYLMQGDDSDEDKTILGLNLFFGDNIKVDDVKDLVEFLRWFINMGNEQEPPSKGPRTFDLIADSGRIYAAFYQAYGINLRKVKMHWWIFCTLLEGLPKSTHLADIIELRGRKPEKWMNAADKLELARLQQHYAIGSDHYDPMAGVVETLKGLYQ